jgi:PLP dependent protein
MNAKLLSDELSHQGVTLVAVTKNQSVDRVKPLYDEGLRDFGENRVQDLLTKYEALPKDIRWHLIGHLQTNKVKFIAPFIQLVHSVDSEKLLNELNEQASRNNRVIDFLLQIRVAKEETKFGLPVADFEKMTESVSRFQNVRLRGVMAMATNTDDDTQIKNEFTQAQTLFENLKQRFPNDTPNAVVDTLSMGMSGDYKLAIECGSNMVRVGSLLFE